MKRCLRLALAFVALLLVGLLFSSVSSENLRAAPNYPSRAEWHGADAATNSNGTLGYNRSKSGAAWYYYEFPSTAKYEDDTNLYLPFNSDYPGPKVAVPAKTCKEYGGFWVLLRNEYNVSTGALTGRPATAIKLSDIKVDDLAGFKNSVSNHTNIITYQKPTASPNDSQDGISAERYGDMNQIYSLYTSLKDTSAVPASAKNDVGNLSYFCASNASNGMPSNSTIMAPIHTFTTVSIENGATSAPVIDGASYLGGYYNRNGNYSSSIAIPTGEALPKVTFHYYVARPYSEYNLKGSGSIATTRGSIPATKLNFDSTTNNVWEIGGTKYIYAEVSTNETSSYSGNSASSGNFSVTGGYYNIATFDFSPASTANPTPSSAKITFVRIPSSGGQIVTSCEQGGNGRYRNGPVIGNTVATVGVSKNNDPVVTTTAAPEDATAKVYAKPGDSVRFSYAICFGAAVPTWNMFRKQNSDERTLAPLVGLNWDSRAIYTTFRVYGDEGDSTTKQPGTLFAPWNETLLGGRVTIANRAIMIGNNFAFYFGSDVSGADGEKYVINNSTFWNGSKRQISFASPDPRNKAGVVSSANKEEDDDIDDEEGFDEYDCAYYTGATKNTFTGYYIPGFNKLDDKVDCASAELAGGSQTSAVGASINQTLQYTFTAAWKPNSGYCGINDRRTINSNLNAAISAYNEAYDGNRSRCTVAGGASSSGTFDIYKTGSIVVPYNFNINLTGKVTNHDSPVVYAGDILDYAGHVDVLPRKNPLTSDKDENGNDIQYATTMPGNTRLKLVEFLIPDSVPLDNVKDKLTQGYLPAGEIENKKLADRSYSTNIAEACEYYEKILGNDIEDCESRTLRGLDADEEKDRTVGNNNSDPKGEMNYYDETLSLVVPDVKAGYKYCAAFAISYGDSHGVPGAELVEDENSPYYAANVASVNETFDTTPTPFRWYGTNVTCKTVAKKPSFETWNNGVFSDDYVTSSVTHKSVNARLGNFIPGTQLPENSQYTEAKIAPENSYFGSWAEYYVVAKGTVSGFSSASALGYRTNLDSRGYGTAETLNYCDWSRLTFGNFNCKNQTAGEIVPAAAKEPTNGIEGVSGKNLRKNILTFYTPPDFADGSYTTYRSKLSTVSPSDYRTWRGAQMLFPSGSFIIDQTIVQPSGTLVIKVDGDLDIDANICLGEGGTCQSGLTDYENYYASYTNDLSLAWRNGLNIDANALNNIPQVILIAKNINISSEVSQIDAWLITYSSPEDTSYSGGYVNTCKGFQDGKTDTNTCWKTLKINGPVITAAMRLNRTGGAWPGYSGDVGNTAYEKLIVAYGSDRGRNLLEALTSWRTTCKAAPPATTTEKAITNCINDRVVAAAGGDQALLKVYQAASRYAANSTAYQAGRSNSRDLTCGGSITSAEILDLHPLVYLWAYAQSQRLGQATINYAQELAPRY